MAKKLHMFLLITAVAVAVMSQYTAAQTVYTVGDTSGWMVPSNGASTYTTWAKNKSFKVGDILSFNFASGNHDVAEVTKSNFNGCNTASPVSLTSNGPANITLKSAGQHYYICTFTGHCSGGQKLAINVSAASLSPAPAPAQAAAPGPELAPIVSPASAPAGPRLPMTYTVGDSLGWNVPSDASNVGYKNWASGKTFMVGDTLVFNYVNGTHNVAEVTKKNYDSCNTSKPISLNANPPTRIIINTTGTHYFTCTFSRHCYLGQQLAINVTGTASALPPSPTGLAPSPTATPPSTSSDGTVAPSSPSDAAGSPPPPNSAMSLGVKSLFVTILSFVVALLMC
ncbi:hypothetical protein ACFE04_010622 [Oxalis oulophora]